MQVGLIGVGLLGTALAKRIAGAGFPLCGFDPDPAARERLAEAGGDPLECAAHVFLRAKATVLCLPGPAQVRELVAIAETAAQPGAFILDSTTGDPADVVFHAARLTGRGIAYLDCEIGGSSKQVLAGDAIVICGGPQSAFDECATILAAVGGRVFHTGPAGTGTRMKLALNIAIGLHRAVLAEALTFAEANGIEASRALEILKSGPAYSRAMDGKGAKMLAGDYVPEARLAQHLKDVRLIRETGRTSGAYLPLTEVHEFLLAEAVEWGLGTMDNSAVIEVFRRRTAP